MAQNKTNEDRQQYVVKANDLIRKTRYSLTTQQQKIILFAISKIRPLDSPNKEYELSIEELCAACGLDIDAGGFYYKSIKDDLRKLTNRLWVKMPDESETTVAWISDATILPLSGRVYIRFHPKMAPFLFELKERYTQYRLEDVLVFRSKYAIRLYEILRSYTTQKAIDKLQEKEVTMTVEELRDILAVDSYPRWADFDRFVIRKAVDEINNCNGEIHVEYEAYRDGGRTISKVNFIISTAHAKQALRARQNKRERL